MLNKGETGWFPQYSCLRMNSIKKQQKFEKDDGTISHTDSFKKLESSFVYAEESLRNIEEMLKR